MSFLSFEFVTFFIAFLCLYWLPVGGVLWRNLLLLLGSYALVALFSLQFAGILAGYSLFIYVLGNHGDRILTPRGVYVLLGLVISGLFVLFKYYGFFSESLQQALAAVGLQVDMPVLALLLPVGLSYYSFHSVSYVVSVQRGELARAGLLDVLLYLAFFPSILAGPINRAVDFMPQIQDAQRSLEQPRKALFLIALAMVKLFLFSAWLAKYRVDPVFADPTGHSPMQNLLAVYAYAWTIYFNFSGYTDLVTGIALFLGFRLPVNFNAPYLATSLKEFWARWHISLSSFIRDYIYFPLGGGRRGWGRMQLNVMLAMVISGLWHGAAMTFVAWGALHGLGVVLLNLKHRLLPARPRGPAGQQVADWLGRLACFHFVCLCWVFFRSDSLDSAWLMLQQIGALELVEPPPADGTFLLAMLALFVAYPLLAGWQRLWLERSNQLRWGLYPLMLAVVLSVAFSLAPEGMPNFIYAGF
ncbi:MAG: MBOAT family protein [Gammaproteobacteria bacterium]|nr:MBOAT family protein [Gammaproteobacteria bacterium]